MHNLSEQRGKGGFWGWVGIRERLPKDTDWQQVNEEALETSAGHSDYRQ